jgi:hypothetical protein
VKYEGGYAAFESGTDYTTNPHGGYDSTTNKCKVCHAVHRAEGAYYLLRADSQDDACDYCHIGGSAHSALVVYETAPGGDPTAATNGHTIGFGCGVPDSSEYQWATPVTLATVDCDGNPVEETVNVRSYDVDRAQMYRFSRHHSQNAVGTGRSGYLKIGPLALRCMSCHHPHNATEEVWRPRTFTAFDGTNYSTSVDGAFATSGYKLMRRYPSGTTSGPVNIYGYYDAPQAVKAIEDSATPGVNFSQNNSWEFQYTENGITRTAPTWIAQDIHAQGSGLDTGAYRYPNKVNTFAFSYWCADCHNLNIGGWEALAEVELGFKAHNERTHPAPFYGAYSGPGQCYSCHRNDLSWTNAGGRGGFATGCSQCHYGTANYAADRTTDYGGPLVANSDFPHSGGAGSIALLGDYSVPDTDNYTVFTTTQAITENNIDAVCLRCHPGIGTHN